MRIDVRRFWKYPLGLALAGLLVPTSTWVADAVVPSSPDMTTAASGRDLTVPDSAYEARLLHQTAERIRAERLAAERAAAEAARAAAEQQAAEEAARAAARLAASQERAARQTLRPQPEVAAAAPDGNDVWAKLRRCESGGDYTKNTGNGYYGAYQFHPGTWRSLGYSGMPHQAPPEVQDEAARRLQERSGWGQWPACSRRIGAR